jgi:hypothetical protein
MPAALLYSSSSVPVSAVSSPEAIWSAAGPTVLRRAVQLAPDNGGAQYELGNLEGARQNLTSALQRRLHTSRS